MFQTATDYAWTGLFGFQDVIVSSVNSLGFDVEAFPDPHVAFNKNDAFRTEANWYNWRTDSIIRRTLLKYPNFYLWAALLYVPGLLLGKYLMRNREPFKMRGPLLCWNIALSVLSGLGAIPTLGYIVYDLTQRSPQEHLCDTSFWTNPATIAVDLFLVSKLFEWMDTVFLILRKKPIIFLHWFHHLCTAVYCWLASLNGDESSVACLWFASINMFVHFVMYAYYAASTLGFRFRATFIITALQTTQMGIGIYAIYTSMSCEGAKNQTMLTVCGVFMYGVYLFLFAKLFAKKVKQSIWKSSKIAQRKTRLAAPSEKGIDTKKKVESIDAGYSSRDKKNK
jgi:hypothetical protein